LELTNDISGQEFSYKDAKNYYYNGLTKSDPKIREEYLAKAFYALGHVIHLIQDLAQPQHTRDDAHPPWTSRTLYEKWTDSILGLLPVNGYPVVTFYSNGPDKFWVTPLGQGLAQFSHFNFVSQGTNFDTHKFLYPIFDYNKRTDLDIQDLCANTKGPLCPNLQLTGKMTFFGTMVEDQYTGITEYNERASTFSVFSPDLEKSYGPGNELFTLNRFNFEEAHKFLIPRAVGYSAGLINYFFRGSIDASLDANGNVIVTNSGSEDMNGTFTLYYDDANDERNPVPGASSSLAIQHGGGTGSLGSFTPPTSPPPKEPGKYILVFEGKMGQENNAVVGKIIKLNPKLVVQKIGTGTGNVTSDPPGIQCDPDCQAEFDAGISVTLKATADQGFVFKEWGGDCSGTQDQTTVVMDGPKSCTAEFAPNKPTLTVSVEHIGTPHCRDPGRRKEDHRT